MSVFRSGTRYARRAPVVSSVAVIILSMGIACVATLFGFLNSVAYRPIPFAAADRIVAVTIVPPAGGASWGSGPRRGAEAVQRDVGSFDRVGLFREATRVLSRADTSYAIGVAEVDSSVVPILGLKAAKGRVFTAAEVYSGSSIAIVSDVFWRGILGASDSAFRQPVVLDGVPYTIVGVLPPGVRFYRRADLLVPLVLGTATAPLWSESYLGVLAKLGRGQTVAGAQARMDLLARRLALVDAGYANSSIRVERSMYNRSGFIPIRALWLIIAVGACVFLVASVNVANLLLVRSAERAPEMAIRSALGASRLRLLAASLAEPLLLGAVAAVLGTFFTIWATRGITYLVPSAAFTAAIRLGIDARVLTVVAALAAFGTVIVGMAPALLAAKSNAMQAMSSGSGTLVGNPLLLRSGRRNVVLQVSTSVTLFIASGLLWRSFGSMVGVDLGFPADRLVQPWIQVSRSQYPSQDDQLRLLQRLAETLARDPRAEATSIRGYPAVYDLTPGQRASRTPSQVELDDLNGIYLRNNATAMAARHTSAITTRWSVDTSFFATVRLRIELGRNFDASDRKGSVPVAIVSAELGRLLWGRRTVLGEQFRIGREGMTFEIVGVVSDHRTLDRSSAADVAPIAPTVYFSSQQVALQAPRIIVRSRGNVPDTKAAIVSHLRRLEPNAAVIRIETIAEEDGAEARLVTRILATLTALMAFAGILLGLIGTFGVVSYNIAVRRREIGLRAALGASGSELVAQFVREGWSTVWRGLVIGLALSIAVSYALHRMLFGVQVVDPAVYGAALFLFSVVGIASAWLPARRAARLDPITALKGIEAVSAR